VRAAWGFARDLFPHDGALPRTLHTAVVCWAGITGMGTLLGALGALTAPPLLAGVAALALALSLPKTRSALLCLCAGQRSAGPAEVKGALGAGARATAGGRVEAAWLAFWGAVLAFWAGRAVVGGLLELPTDWDTLMYHLPLVDHFLQARGLYSEDCAVWYNPCNNELVGLWMVAPFSGDFLIALNNLPAGIVFVLATVGLGGQLGLGRGLGHLTALAALANFAVVRQLLDAGNDVPVAGFLLAALSYGLRYVRAGHRPDLLLASTSLGLGAGVKYFALGPATAVGTALVLAAGLLRGPRQAGRVLVVGLLGALLGGGFWYARNAVRTGLPLYPMGLGSANDPLLEMYPDPWGSTLLGNGRPEVLPLVERALWQFAGPCHYVAFLLLPALVLGLAATAVVCGCRDRKVEGTFRLVLCIVLVGSGLALGATPFGAETLPGSLNMLQGGYSPVRFGLCFYSLTLLALALLLQDFSRVLGSFLAWVAPAPERAARLLVAFLAHLPQAAFAAAALYQAFTVFRGPLPGDLGTAALLGANLLLAGWVVWLAWLAWPGLRRGLALALGLGCCAAAGWAADALGQRWHARFAGHYDRLLHTKTFGTLAARGPAETRICALSYRYYPLLGSGRQFRVCQPKRVRDLPALLEYLRAHDLTTIAVLNADPFENGTYRDRAEWLRRSPGLFEPLRPDQTLSLFRVDRRAVEEALRPPEGKAASGTGGSAAHPAHHEELVTP
jgi:hypothetical protein